MQSIYERWLSCGEDWSKSSWAISLTSTTTENRRGCRRWMTKLQIEKKYESADVANEIVAQKLLPEFAHQRKNHPDLPHREDTLLDRHHFFLWDHVSIVHKSIQHRTYDCNPWPLNIVFGWPPLTLYIYIYHQAAHRYAPLRISCSFWCGMRKAKSIWTPLCWTIHIQRWIQVQKERNARRMNHQVPKRS